MCERTVGDRLRLLINSKSNLKKKRNRVRSNEDEREGGFLFHVYGKTVRFSQLVVLLFI